MLKIIATTAVAFMLAITPVSARYVISNDNGGSVQPYEDLYDALNQSGGYIKITGECISACTLIIPFVNKDHVCVDKQSFFGFHSVKDVNPQTKESKHSPEGTRYMWQLYPAWVQDLLKDRGWDGKDGAEHSELIIFPGTMFYEECGPGQEV